MTTQHATAPDGVAIEIEIANYPHPDTGVCILREDNVRVDPEEADTYRGDPRCFRTMDLARQAATSRWRARTDANPGSGSIFDWHTR